MKRIRLTALPELKPGVCNGSQITKLIGVRLHLTGKQQKNLFNHTI